MSLAWLTRLVASVPQERPFGEIIRQALDTKSNYSETGGLQKWRSMPIKAPDLYFLNGEYVRNGDERDYTDAAG